MNNQQQEIICLESAALRKLITSVVEELKKAQNVPLEPEWINEAETMRLLNISSKNTLLKFRNEGLITFSKTTPKNLLYQRKSVMDYIQKNTKKAFQ